MSVFIVSADFVGPGEFYVLSKPSSEYIFTANVLQHSTNGRVLLTTAYDPTASIWSGAIVSSEGTTTLHLSTASSQGAVLVSGTLRNSHADGSALRIWGAGSVTEVYENGSILARGASGTAINLAVNSANTTAKINNHGEISGFRAIDRFGSEGVEITNTGRITASGGTAYRDMFGGVDVILNNGTISGQIEFGAGDDVYNGQNGYLTGRIYGGGGNDVLRGGLSSVYFWGENGDDELSGSALGDQLYAGDGNDKVWGGDGSDLIEGWSGHDKIYGDGGSDTVYGNTGDDEISGGSGDDVLWGQEDNDRLSGGAGNDYLVGGSGSDKFIPGIGADSLHGGAASQLNDDGARDMFDYNSISHSGITTATRDSIAGFFTGITGDKIDLSGIDANGSKSGDGKFTFIGSGSFGSDDISQVQVRATGNANEYMVKVDIDKDNGSEMQILVYSTSALTAADFIL